MKFQIIKNNRLALSSWDSGMQDTQELGQVYIIYSLGIHWQKVMEN